MQLSINNQNFNSRNAVIRNADDIARKVATDYIKISVTKLYDLPRNQQYINDLIQIGQKSALKKGELSEVKINIENLFKQNKISEWQYKSLLKALSCVNSFLKLDKKLTLARKEMIKIEFDNKLNPINKITKYLSLSKKHRIGNCAEYTDVAMILGHFRKIKGMYTASLFTKDDKSLDHAVLYVDNNGKPYIIDAWLGFADYLDNAICKYKTIYKHHFPVDDIIIQRDKYSKMHSIIEQC